MAPQRLPLPLHVEHLPPTLSSLCPHLPCLLLSPSFLIWAPEMLGSLGAWVQALSLPLLLSQSAMEAGLRWEAPPFLSSELCSYLAVPPAPENYLSWRTSGHLSLSPLAHLPLGSAQLKTCCPPLSRRPHCEPGGQPSPLLPCHPLPRTVASSSAAFKPIHPSLPPLPYLGPLHLLPAKSCEPTRHPAPS